MSKFAKLALLQNSHLMLLSVLLLPACGGSVVYKDRPKALPALPPATASATQNPIMSFTATPTTDSRSGAVNLIFATTTPSTPFDVNNAQTQWVVDMKVKSESVDEQTFENFVHARFKIMIVSSSKIVLSREFESEGTLNLKNLDNKDQMLGTFRDVDTGNTVLSINATRSASATEAEALRNPWAGTLSLVETNHSETKLGDIKGYFSGLLSTPQPSP